MQTRSTVINFFVSAGAMVLVLIGYEAYRVFLMHRTMRASYIVEGITVFGAAKRRVVEFHDQTGRWPVSNKECELPDEQQFTGQALRGLQVSDGGVITLTFDGKTGVNGGTLRFTPDASNQEMGVKWDCTTSSYPEITQWAPQCRYQQ